MQRGDFEREISWSGEGKRGEGSRLHQKLVHLRYKAKLQEHITLAVMRIRAENAAAGAGK